MPPYCIDSLVFFKNQQFQVSVHCSSPLETDIWHMLWHYKVVGSNIISFAFASVRLICDATHGIHNFILFQFSTSMFCQLNIKQKLYNSPYTGKYFHFEWIKLCLMFVITVNWTKIFWHGILNDTMTVMHNVIVKKKIAHYNPAVNIALYKTFILRNLRISMASLLKYFNPCL